MNFVHNDRFRAVKLIYSSLHIDRLYYFIRTLVRHLFTLIRGSLDLNQFFGFSTCFIHFTSSSFLFHFPESVDDIVNFLVCLCIVTGRFSLPEEVYT